MNHGFPILIDVDGVCLDWLTPFLRYMGKPHIPVLEHDLANVFPGVNILNKIECFHQTTDFHHIALAPGVADGVRRLWERFPKSLKLAVTACGTDEMVQKARRYQLRHLPLDGIIHLPLNADKRNVFGQFSPGMVVEDNLKHARSAADVGHNTYLIDRTYNQGSGSFTRVQGWEDIGL